MWGKKLWEKKGEKRFIFTLSQKMLLFHLFIGRKKKKKLWENELRKKLWGKNVRTKNCEEKIEKKMCEKNGENSFQ